MLRHIGFLISTMIMYFFESIFIGLFVNLAWRYVLYDIFPIAINYFQWVFIIWIIKMLLYDVLKTPIDENHNAHENNNHHNEKNSNNNDYNDINKLNFS